jgi:hypothetical protein
VSEQPIGYPIFASYPATKSSAAPITLAADITPLKSGARLILFARTFAEMPCCNAMLITTLASSRMLAIVLGAGENYLCRMSCPIEANSGQ